MKQNHTDITIVLDQSGSMESNRGDTIGGYNTFVEAQKAGVGTADITLVRFNHLYTPAATKSVQEAERLTADTYRPDGYTALLDAVGKAIVEAGGRLSKDPAEKVVFVIITDGQENASKEYSLAQVKQMIETQRKQWNWQFVFLGADQDAFVNAGAMGVSASNTSNYSKGNTGGTMKIMADKVMMFRADVAGDMSFTQKERDDMQ